MWGSSLDKKNRHRQYLINLTKLLKLSSDMISLHDAIVVEVVKEQQIRQNFIRKYSNPIIENKCK